MKSFTRDEFRQLALDAGRIRLSLYEPLPDNRMTDYQPVAQKMLRSAHAELSAFGAATEALTRAIAAAPAAARDAEQQAPRARGIALFASPIRADMYWLDYALDRVVFSGPRFYLRPMLPTLRAPDAFYVLALSQNGPRVLACKTGHPLMREELALSGMPMGIGALPQHEDLDLHRHAKTFSRSLPGGHFMTHSPGAGDIDRSPKVLAYAKEVDHALRANLAERPLPLVVAAVDDLATVFAETSAYPMLVARHISGNPDRMTAAELAAAAASIITEQAADRPARALQYYQTAVGMGLATTDLAQILRASGDGRIATLFIPRFDEHWGVYDPGTGELVSHSEPAPGLTGLFDYAAAHTIAHRGVVHELAPADVPGPSRIAATLRY